MRNLIKHTFIWFIIVGSLAWATAMISGQTLPTFVSTYTIQIGTYTKEIYKLDIYNYLKQIENLSINIPIEQIFYEPPSAPNVAGFADVMKLLPNLFVWYFNWLMWWMNNLIIAPTKLLIYPLLFFVTILGIDINSNHILGLINTIMGFTFPVIDYI